MTTIEVNNRKTSLGKIVLGGILYSWSDYSLDLLNLIPL